jgi:hypothetical protein
LIRVRIGNVELGRLAAGEIRPLMSTEIIRLKRGVGLQDSRPDPRGPREEIAPALVVEQQYSNKVSFALAARGNEEF